MQRTGFGGASCDIGRHLTAARRMELAAARELFNLCAKVREVHCQPDAFAVEALKLGCSVE